MIYAFGEYELDTQSFTLHRSGHLVRLRPKECQVLVFLLEHRDRVVDKQELCEQIWPEQPASESTLGNALQAVRQTLVDSGQTQPIIETLHGRGYRFVAVVTERVEAGHDDRARIELAVSASPPELRRDDVVTAPARTVPVVTDDQASGATLRCSACQHINHIHAPGRARFCIECGAPLPTRCPQCGVETPPLAKFCAACGTPLTKPPLSASPPPTESEAETSEDERRQLTVMFCDLVGSTSLANELDLEDYRYVISVYQAMCTDVIQRFDGHIAQYLGDGLLVYFGYPQAYEDNAQRAVRAGLEMVEALGILNTRLQRELGVQLAVRVGIYTGPVILGVVGSDKHNERLALGNTPNIAARIQALAAPNTIMIGAVTAHLVQGYFACEDLGLHTLKGLSVPVNLFRVLRATGAQSRLEAVDLGKLTPLVGREAEVALLRERWGHAKAGLGQVVVVSGEAGIGKSRLVRVLKDHLLPTLCIQLECRCSPYYQHSAFYPVIELCQQLFQWQPDETPEGRQRKLEVGLDRLDLLTDDTVDLFANLLSLPDTGNDSSRYLLTPQQRRQKTLEAILALVVELASRCPVLLIVEDLHWIDPSTLEFLTLLQDQTAKTRLCLVMTTRPMFHVPWASHSHLTQIILSRLARHHIEQIVTGVTGGKALPPELLQQVIDKTDGVPLYAEECTKTVLETQLLREVADRYELAAPLPAVAIPTTLHDSLLARLDRLGQAKRVAQLGATIGRQFSYALLHAVMQADEASLQRDLGRLIEAELLYQQGSLPGATYMFKHALIQDAAYQSLVRRTRQHYHQHIAQVLVARFPDTVATQPELLAHHYGEAGLNEEAVPYWQQAGQRAIERSANVEAISHLTKGLEILETLPVTHQHMQQKLMMQLTLGTSLLTIKGPTAQEVQDAYTRAQELCQQVGDSPQLFSVLMGLWRFNLTQSRHQTARELGEQCFALAQRMRAPALLHEAHMMLGSTLIFLGELTAAHTHLSQSIDLYDPEQCRSLLVSRGLDPGVASLSRMAFVLWKLGYPDQALAKSFEALALSRESDHAYSQGFALHYVVYLHQFRREAQRVREMADTAMALAREQGFVLWLSGSTILKGWALAELGAAEEGIEQIHEGLTTWQAIGAELGRPHHLALLAEAYSRGGQAEKGLHVLADALAAVHKTSERHYEAELYRLKGELILRADQKPKTEEAEMCFRYALDVSRRQQARSLELRAALSLSRLWRQQGKRLEILQMLAGAYGWFTEGFDTPDLQEANALLTELT